MSMLMWPDNMGREMDEIIEAMQDGRVRRALARALFDAQVRREYRELRAQGQLVREAVETLAARHHCSEETIRTIIYDKRERQTRSQRG